MIDMSQETAIGISLHIDDKIIDLQIPKQVTIARLKKLFIESFCQHQLSLPEAFELVVLNKSIRLSDEAFLSDYPISEGDQLLIKPC